MHVGRTVSSTTAAAVAQAQINTLLDLVDQIQGSATAQATTARLGIARPDTPGSGDGGGWDGDSGGISNSYSYTINSNLLWILITNVYDATVYANLYPGTDCVCGTSVYGIFSTTNLALPLSQWQPETEVWPTDTNCMPFVVATLGRPDLFLTAANWTGVELNGLPCWWTFYWFGNLNESASDTDWLGLSLAFDYAHGRDPNVLQFSVQFTNSFVNIPTVSRNWKSPMVCRTIWPYW
jgi:hypothetical protein